MTNFNERLKEMAETQKVISENEQILQEIENEKKKTIIDKVDSLRKLLESITIDEEGTIINSEPKLKSVLNESDVYKVKEKLFQLIEKY